MSRYIDADMLEKDGWNMQRIRQASATEMVYETKKPTDFPAADVVKRVYRGPRPSDNLVKVGRCKDCKHRGYQYRDFHGTEKVVCWKYGYGIPKNANGYCDDWDFRDEKDGEQDG